jgi:hypothetical protein
MYPLGTFWYYPGMYYATVLSTALICHILVNTYTYNLVELVTILRKFRGISIFLKQAF